MKPELQRLTLAEISGWIWIRVKRERGDTFLQLVTLSTAEQVMKHYEAYEVPRPREYGREWLNTPDYLEDMNAARAAAIAILEENDALWMTFWDALCDVTKALDLHETGRPSANLCERRLLSATAAQWTEALLRTIGRWEESEEPAEEISARK